MTVARSSLHFQVEAFGDHSFSLEWVHSKERARFAGVAEHAAVAAHRDVLGFPRGGRLRSTR
jgi:hypothetical protein